MSATRAHSFTLWIVALPTPISTTCAPVGAMKRPSEVPPVVEKRGVVTRDLVARPRHRLGQHAPAGVRNGRPETNHSIV